MAEFASLRRYCLYKRFDAKDRCDSAMASLWQSKQNAEPGTPLPVGFPSKAELEAVGYTTDADLTGADCAELADYVGLSRRQAEKVLAAAAAL